MTNLYDFLRHIKAQADKAVPGAAPLSRDLYITITEADRDWLTQYMHSPDVQIHFKAKDTGQKDPQNEPIMELDLAISGDGFEVFALLCEAMVQNYQFAEMVQRAVAFYRDHIPTCPICSVKHFGAKEPPKNWIFSHEKPDINAKQ
jgi:hypothetical protein